MKANMALPAITLLLCLIIGNSSVSLAGDSGEERTIPVIEWGCWSCNKRVFTFTPDSLDGKIIQHKDPNYQQSKWIILKTRSPIKKCEKMFDGAHIFDKKREFMTSGYTTGRQFCGHKRRFGHQGTDQQGSMCGVPKRCLCLCR